MISHQLKLLGSLFYTFLKMSPVSFGGGYALIPVIEREVVDKHKWLRLEEVTDIVAVSGTIPGAIAINSATFIGYRIAGVRGAIAAMLGILLPSFCIVVGLSIFYLEVKDNPKIEAAFVSIRATIVALIVYAAIKIGKTAAVDKTAVVLILLSVAILYFGSAYVHPLLLIVGGAGVGIMIMKIRAYLGKEIRMKKDEQVYDYMI
jgi:chromate transporter